MRITRVTMAPALVACGAMLAGALLAGCGSGGSQPPAAGGTGNTQAAGAPEDAITTLIQCYRSHGDPGFPDPVYDPGDGRWHFAISPDSAPASTRAACQRLMPDMTASPPVPQAQFEQLVRLAECIRQHGVPAWPDPDPDGAFGLPPALQVKTPAYARAAQACQRLMPSGGLNVYAAS
jgi:hypothetical protein